jgi:hypothetical protein
MVTQAGGSKMATMPKCWSLVKAKRQCSQLVRAAEAAPQFITRHGKVVGVLLAPAFYDQLVGNQSATVTFFNAPDVSDLPELVHHPRADPRELDL